MAETVLQRLFDEMHGAPLHNKLSNSELINAMHSPTLEVRNIAIIIGRRRGIQVVEVERGAESGERQDDKGNTMRDYILL